MGTRAQQCGSRLQGLALPYVINLSGDRRVRIDQIRVTPDANAIEISIDWTKSGVRQPFDNPWVIVNPPLLMLDPAGDVEISSRDKDGIPTTRKYREDPLAVLVAMMDRQLR